MYLFYNDVRFFYCKNASIFSTSIFSGMKVNAVGILRGQKLYIASEKTNLKKKWDSYANPVFKRVIFIFL